MLLEPVAEKIWLVEGEIVNFYGFPYPTRSVVIQLVGGDLWVWSPVKLTPELKATVEALGRVAHLVSPNKIHHLYLQEWKDAFPEALLWGPESTIRKRSDLQFQQALEDTVPADWSDEIDQAWFRGSIVFDEIVFLHRASRTAIIADLSENFSQEFLKKHWGWWKRIIANIWKIAVPYGYAPLEMRWSWLDRKAGKKALDKLLSWQSTRVIMAHGEWQKENGQAYLEKAFSWLK